MKIEQKIDLINAYRALLDHVLPTKKFTEENQTLVQAEFKQWIEGKVNVLLGGTTSGAEFPFDEKEIKALKALANRQIVRPQPVRPQAPRPVSVQPDIDVESQPNPDADGFEEREERSAPPPQPLVLNNRAIANLFQED